MRIFGQLVGAIIEKFTDGTKPTATEGRLVWLTDLKKAQIGDGTNWKDVGSGSGDSGNLFTSSDAEAGTADFVEGAVSLDSNGFPTGWWAEASGLLSNTNTNPLKGTRSYKLAKGAQGKAIAKEFDIPRGLRATVLQVTALTEIIGTGYADGDLRVAVQFLDGGGSHIAFAQPSAYKIMGKPLPGPIQPMEFQTPYNAATGRLIIYQATSATAWTGGSEQVLVFDDLFLGKKSVAQGTPVTDWVSYTPTYAGFGTVATSSMKYRRVGDTIELYGHFATGTPTATTASLSLPAGLTGSDQLGRIVGHWWRGNAQASAAKGGSIIAPVSATQIRFGLQETANATTPESSLNGNAIVAAGENIYIKAFVPILGWSSSTTLSENAATGPVVARYTSAVAQSFATSTPTIIDFGTKVRDDGGRVTSGAAWKFTASVPGDYVVDAAVLLASASYGAGNVQQMVLHKNGVAYSNLQYQVNQATSTRFVRVGGTDTIYLNAGEYIDVRLTQNEGANRALHTDATHNFISIKLIQGPSQIAASDTVAARAYSTTPTGTIASSWASATAVVHGSKSFDRTGSYSTTTGKFTCPRAGLVRVKAVERITGNLTAGSTYMVIGLGKDGTEISESALKFAEATATGGSVGTSFEDTIEVLQGNLLEVRVISNAVSPSFTADPLKHYVAFEYVGN